MMPTTMLRTVTSGAFAGAAKTLSAASRMADLMALRLRGGPTEGPGPVGPLTTDEVMHEIDRQRDEAEPPTRRAGRRSAAERRQRAAEAGPEQPDVGPADAGAPDRRARSADVPDIAPEVTAEVHARKPETHAAELAGKPASDLIRLIDGLSTDELRLLYEHEQSNKRRKTVLAAIERALSPDEWVAHTSG